MKVLGLQLRAFISFSVFGTSDKKTRIKEFCLGLLFCRRRSYHG